MFGSVLYPPRGVPPGAGGPGRGIRKCPAGGGVYGMAARPGAAGPPVLAGGNHLAVLKSQVVPEGAAGPPVLAGGNPLSKRGPAAPLCHGTAAYRPGFVDDLYVAIRIHDGMCWPPVHVEPPWAHCYDIHQRMGTATSGIRVAETCSLPKKTGHPRPCGTCSRPQ